MELWTAFILGIGGSLHCIGMCGPIVLALPSSKNNKVLFLWGRILYNFGRAITYALLGIAAGLVGHTISAGGYQQGLSITLGILILIAVVVPRRWTKRILPASVTSKLFGKIKARWTQLFGRDSLLSLFMIGLFNGFLPCGLVYAALAGATSTGTVIGGMSYMFIFGIGTIPVMLGISLAGGLIGMKVRRAMNRLVPVGAFALAALLILRGLSLGIPFVSPKMEQNVETGQTEVSGCCPTPKNTTTTDSLEIK